MSKQAILALMVDDVEARRVVIGDFIKDETNSYEDRKEVWLATPDHLYTEGPWILHLGEYEKKYGEISWYDNFGAERYSDVDLVGAAKDATPGDDEWSYFKTQEQLDDFIAACIKEGVHSFNYDW